MSGRFIFSGCLIGLSVFCCVAQPTKHDVIRDAVAGRTLKSNEVVQLEAVVAKNPEDLSARVKLLGYYQGQALSSTDARKARQKHILWLIQHHPEADINGSGYTDLNLQLDGSAFEQGKQFWLQQAKAHDRDAIILGHAADFFLIHDPAVAEELLKKAQAADPGNPRWPDKLGHLYALGRGRNPKSGSMALGQLEKAQSLDKTGDSRFYRLDGLANAAFESGDTNKAGAYARELLDTAEKYAGNWNYGNAIHHGNLILGRIAAKQGDLKRAGEFLLKAGLVPGSPQLNSFGPNMSLAKDLLEKGERDVVLRYFDLCRKFWKSGPQGELDRWTADIKAGKVPNFGANLYY